MRFLLYARLLVSLIFASFLSTCLVLHPTSLPDVLDDGCDQSLKVVETARQQRRLAIDDGGRIRHIGEGIGQIGPVISCGRKKCLFPISQGEGRKNETKRGRSGEGYLIFNGGAKQHKRAYDSWRYSKFLEYHYGVRQTLLGQPLLVNVTEDFVSYRLNADMSRLAYKNTTRRFVAGPAVLQPVKILPGPWLLVGCYARHDSAVKKLGQFISNIVNSTQGDLDYARTRFMTNLIADLNKTEDILQQSEVQCLFHDFQLILSAEGRLHHIDLDRCLAQVRRRDGRGKIHSADKARCLGEMQDLVEKSRSHWEEMS